MIRDVELEGFPCFGAEAVLSDLTTINYVFGPNGSGKTTISQCLASDDSANTSSVRWEQQANTVKVYNRTYVRTSFTSADGEEPGVFLLGDDSRETFQRIEVLQDEQKKTIEKISRSKENLDKFAEEVEAKRSALADKVWKRRNDIPEVLKDQMPGLKGSMNQCLSKVLNAAKNHSERGEDTFATLASKAQSAFDETVEETALLRLPPQLEWDETALQEALASPIVGSADVPLADLINRLGISDWVREGLGHLHDGKNTTHSCPFCQQEVPEGFAEELEKMFDETYQVKRDQVVEFHKILNEASVSIRSYKADVFDQIDGTLSSENVEQVFRSLEIAIDDTLNSVQNKLNKPSSSVNVSSIQVEYDALKELVLSANEAIETTNSIVVDRRRQRRAIVDAAWQEFARGHLNDLIEGFEQDTARIQKSINGLRRATEEHESRRAEVERELRELTRKTTSSAGAIQDINDLLALSQFHSFRLDAASSKPDGYRIIRQDGQPADIETLSEGERTFITFLYFYHSLSAVRQDGEAEKVVAVIDDPISSLDGDIMFVVSALIRKLVQEVRVGDHDRVCQVIMLTHNTRFHNEVCYRHQGEVSPAVKFYRIRRFSPDASQLEDCGQKNPIRTAYQELWDEVAAAESRPEGSMPWLPNVLRRILESYFTTLGGRGNLYELGEELPISERALHDALIAWSHSGSHTIMDAENYAQPVATNNRWLAAFARIFEKYSGGAHLGHYEMMMDEARKHLAPAVAMASSSSA